MLQQILNRCIGEWSYYFGCCPKDTPKYVCIYNELTNVLTVPNYLGGWMILTYMCMIFGMGYIAIESYNVSEFKKEHETMEATLRNKITYLTFLFIGVFAIIFGIYGAINNYTTGYIVILLGFIYITGYWDISRSYD